MASGFRERERDEERMGRPTTRERERGGGTEGKRVIESEKAGVVRPTLLLRPTCCHLAALWCVLFYDGAPTASLSKLHAIVGCDKIQKGVNHLSK